MQPVYALNDEQIEIQNLARDFAKREFLPCIEKYERESIVDSPLLAKICQSGLVNTRIPVDYGGLGLTLFDTCLIAEEFAFACSGISAIAEASELAITILLKVGTEDQKRKYLSMLSSENALAGIILDFSVFGKTDAVAKGTANGFVLNGQCAFALNAPFARWLIVTCPYLEKSDLKPKLAHFIVPTNSVGLQQTEFKGLFGRKANAAYSLKFDNVELEQLAKIDCADYSQDNLGNLPIISSGCSGIAHAAFTYAKKYSLERQTFGLPLAKHQTIAFMMADMRADIEAGRMLNYAAIESLRVSSINLKLAFSNLIFALEMAARVSNDAVQIFGAYGYTKDYPVEKLMRDAKAFQMLFAGMTSRNLD